MTIAAAVLAGVVYAVPAIRKPALEFWGGLLHATTLLRREAEQLGTPGAAAQPVSAIPAVHDSAITNDTTASPDSTLTGDSSIATQPEYQRVPLVLQDSIPERSPVGPAPFRMTGSPYGWIRVTVIGGTAPIIIDGQSYGSAPQTIRVQKGAHIVSVRGAGDMFMPFQHDIVVREGDTVLAAFEVPVRRTPVEPQTPPPPLSSDTVANTPPQVDTTAARSPRQ
jgi:hypothetical protein